MIITYKGTLESRYEAEDTGKVREEDGTPIFRKVLKEVYLKSSDGYHDIPERIESKLRYRIERGQLKAGDEYEFTIDIEAHIAYLYDQLNGPDNDANLNPEQIQKIEEEIEKWKKELE